MYFCPVAAILAYFPSVPGPVFILKNGSPMLLSWLVQAVCENMTDAGLDRMDYSGHSFRIGTAMADSQAWPV